jgi:endoglucanase
LMNEPAHMPLNDWAILAKRTLAALRNAGARNRVFIGGGGWNGLHSWFNVKDGHSNATAFATLKDPLNRTTIEVHQYADSNYSGTTPECLPASDFEEKFERITRWAQQHKLQLFLGEFGVTTTADCLHTLERFLQLMEGSTWKGWTYWAAGRWWGTYAFALSVNTEPPSAQWLVLKRYFYIPLANQSMPTSPPMPPMLRH